MPRLRRRAKKCANPVQAVVDTNVWVSAFLTPGGTAAKLLDAMYGARLMPVYSAPIEAEYRAVLTRAKFNIGAEVLADFFSNLPVMGQFENKVPPLSLDLPDHTDAPFIALARYARCPVITGNTKHFPKAAGVVVLTPAQWVAAQAGG